MHEGMKGARQVVCITRDEQGGAQVIFAMMDHSGVLGIFRPKRTKIAVALVTRGFPKGITFR